MTRWGTSLVGCRRTPPFASLSNRVVRLRLSTSRYRHVGAYGVTACTYDAGGRLTSVAGPDGTVTTHTWDGQGRLVSTVIDHPEVAGVAGSSAVPIPEDTDAGVPDQPPNAGGLGCTITGTSGADTLEGTPGDAAVHFVL